MLLAVREHRLGQVPRVRCCRLADGCRAQAQGCQRRCSERTASALFPVHRLLFLKLTAQNPREKFAFCSVKGCERIRIKALIPKDAGVSDCSATAYPRFAERATVDVPMPRKLAGAQLVSGRPRSSRDTCSAQRTSRAGAGAGGDDQVYGHLLRPNGRAGRVCFPEDTGPLLGGEDGEFWAAVLPPAERLCVHRGKGSQPLRRVAVLSGPSSQMTASRVA